MLGLIRERKRERVENSAVQMPPQILWYAPFSKAFAVLPILFQRSIQQNWKDKTKEGMDNQ